MAEDENEEPIKKKNLISKNRKVLKNFKTINENIPYKLRTMADFIQAEMIKNIDLCEKNALILKNLPNEEFINPAPSFAVAAASGSKTVELLDPYVEIIKDRIEDATNRFTQFQGSISTATSTASTLFSGISSMGYIQAQKDPNFKEIMDEIKTPTSFEKRYEVEKELRKINPVLTERFLGAWQALDDASKRDRVRQAASSMREVLSGFEHALAPKKEVMGAEWYIQNPDTNGPTQKQRVKYAIVGETDEGIDYKDIELIEKLMDNARDTYEDLNGISHNRSAKDEELHILTKSYMKDVQDIILAVLKLRRNFGKSLSKYSS